jgi:hypothetical protein
MNLENQKTEKSLLINSQDTNTNTVRVQRSMNRTLWTATSSNPKTGNVPTAWVGEAVEETEETCSACPMRGDCYAHNGPTKLAMHSIHRANRANPNRYDRATAYGRSVRTANIVRVTALGDVGHPSADQEQVLDDLEYWVEKGFKIVGYTHYWRMPHAQPLKKYLRASCETWEQAKRAISMGWKPVIISDKTVDEVQSQGIFTQTYDNLVGKVCMYYTSKVDCNNCRLCSTSNDEIILFPRR